MSSVPHAGGVIVTSLNEIGDLAKGELRAWLEPWFETRGACAAATGTGDGPMGPVGPSGPAGATGPAGPAGPPPEFGHVATLPATGEEGYIYFVADTGHGWSWHDATGWEDLGSFLGPPGPPGPDTNYVHTQSVPASTWSVVHSLGKFPAVNVVDSGGNWLLPDVLWVDANHVTVTFGAATSGKVFVN